LDIFKNTGDFTSLQGRFASLQGGFAFLQGSKAFLQGSNLTSKHQKTGISEVKWSIRFGVWVFQSGMFRLCELTIHQPFKHKS